MTVGLNSWDCLQTINDPNTLTSSNRSEASLVFTPSTTSGIAAFSSTSMAPKNSSSTENNLVNPTTTVTTTNPNVTTISQNNLTINSSEILSTQPLIANQINEFANGSHHSLTSIANHLPIKKPIKKSGRNHAGAKYLASQYTICKYKKFLKFFFIYS
jgi:hypothetical protein